MSDADCTPGREPRSVAASSACGYSAICVVYSYIATCSVDVTACLCHTFKWWRYRRMAMMMLGVVVWRRELSFRRGDVLHLIRQLDKNWFEARLHGRVGIVPANYLQVSHQSLTCTIVSISSSSRCCDSQRNDATVTSWMDQDATWYGGRHRPGRHCVRWGPSYRPRKGAPQPPTTLFGPLCSCTAAHLSNCWAILIVMANTLLQEIEFP